MGNSEASQSRERFGFTALAFGILALITWRWTQVCMVLAVMSVGFGAVAFRSKPKWITVLAISLGVLGIVLSLTWAFLRWPKCEISLSKLDPEDG
jgi:hypothetical protein